MEAPDLGAEGAALDAEDAADLGAQAAALADLRQSAEALFSALADRIEDAGRCRLETAGLRAAAERDREAWDRERAALRAELDAEGAKLRAEREALEREKLQMAHPSASPSDVLTLNLGGEKVVQRWRSTLCVVEDSFLAARFSGRWERGLDRDEEGRHFINYPPYLFMPLLDYLSTVQTETHAVPLPCGPEDMRPQFEAMMRYFGLMPAVATLDVLRVPYASTAGWDYGLAFEVVTKAWPVSLTALETCAGRGVTGSASAKVYVCTGALQRRLRQRDEWLQVAAGPLSPGRASRLEFAKPAWLQANATHCIYIATDCEGGVAYGDESRSGEVCGGSEDLDVLAGRPSGSRTPFMGFEGFIHWFPFNGTIEYTVETKTRHEL